MQNVSKAYQYKCSLKITRLCKLVESKGMATHIEFTYWSEWTIHLGQNHRKLYEQIIGNNTKIIGNHRKSMKIIIYEFKFKRKGLTDRRQERVKNRERKRHSERSAKAQSIFMIYGSSSSFRFPYKRFGLSESLIHYRWLWR